MYQYLPRELIPDDLDDMSFEDFYRVVAKAQIARDMYRDDIIIGVNKGYVLAQPDPSG